MRVQRVTVVAAVASGLAAGVAAVAVAAGGSNGRESGSASFLAATHLPPLLTLPGETPTLRYAIVCGDEATLAAGAPCDGAGELYIRPGHSGPFRQLSLTRGADSAHGRYFAAVPSDVAFDPRGFSYYAVLRDETSGETTTLPAAGAAAPQNSYPLRAPVSATLGQHRFGTTRAADSRDVSAPWGTGAGHVGLSGGETAARIGPSSFDVGADGTIAILDEVNGRVVRWRRGVASSVPVAVPPALDDMAVGPDGSIYVADGVSTAGRTPLLRTFAPDGRLRATEHLPERTWAQVRVGPSGPVVQEHPSEQWMPPANAAAGRAGRPLADGSRLIVLRVGSDEVRIARLVNGSVHESWLVRSETPLAEVQLADLIGNRLVLVVKTYTDREDEYDVLVVGARGVENRFSVPSSAWAETAPLARFRLAGATLYHFGSTPAGAFVDGYDLGGLR